MKLFVKLFFIILSINTVLAQNKSDLQDRKKQLLEEIKWSNSLLKETKKNKVLSLNQLKSLNKKIDVRKQLIQSMQQELMILNEEIELSKRKKSLLENDLDSLKQKFSLLVQQAYKNNRHFNRLLFLFSSKDFHQAYKRTRYIKQVSKYRKSQAKEIQKKQEALEGVIIISKKHKAIKQNLITNKRLENELLKQEQVEQSIGLAALSEKENDLKFALEKKEEQHKKIQKEIRRIIAEELKSISSMNSKKSFEATPESIALSKGFVSNKSRFPWPVAKGLIISKYGKQKHPVLKGVTIDNNGIEIATEAHSPCRTIFDGKVSSILTMPNNTKVVMIRHGEYISVYSNLSEVIIEKDELLKTKDQIGYVYTSKMEGGSVLDFQLWKGSQKLNPESWLLKR